MSAAHVWRRCMRRKPIEMLLAETGGDVGDGQLKRSIGTARLAMVGIGSTIGTGIFVVLNQAVPHAGPAVILSFVLAGITAALTALCYAELASQIPVAGASYTYAYVTLGELVAYVVGSCLLLEYGVAAAAVAVGWGEYVNELLSDVFGYTLPQALSAAPEDGGVVNLPSVILVAACCVLLIRGTKESATINAVTVVVKIAVLALFAVIAFTAFRSDNLAPFAPMGMAGISSAASLVFFSYVGMDLISTGSEEVRDPRRTVPMAIIVTVSVVTAVYCVVAVAGVAAQPWRDFEGQKAGLAAILRITVGADWPAILISAGGVVSIFGVTLVTIYGQTRVLYSMGRDGMLPKVFNRVSPKTRTPIVNTVIVSIAVGVLAALVPLHTLANLTSLGTLVAFIIVSVGVVVLRKRQRGRGETAEGFRVPLYPLTPILSIVACGYLIVELPSDTYLLFGVWVAAALVLYFTWGARHSRLEESVHDSAASTSEVRKS